MLKIFSRDVTKLLALEGLKEAVATKEDSIILASQEVAVSQENRFSLFLCQGTLKLTEERGGGATLTNLETNEVQTRPDGFKVLDEILASYNEDKIIEGDGKAEAVQTFAGGWAGFISYDRQQHLPKKIPTYFKGDDYIGLPLLYFVFYPEAVVYDNLDGSLTALSCRSETKLETYLKYLTQLIQETELKKSQLSKDISVLETTSATKAQLHTSISEHGYLTGLEAVHEAIRRGQVYQINYTQRFTAPLHQTPFALFKRLEKRNPAPYAAFMNMGDTHIVSSSPECFIKVAPIEPAQSSEPTVSNVLMQNAAEREIVTRPIKGTIKRTLNEAQDRVLAQELAQSAKDRSELLMIVDLERNDLGRISTFGSVKVPELFKIEAYPTLYHLVSEVRGVLNLGLTWTQILEAVFPGGSITGAPKLAAMECIAALEQVPRELYTGSIGFISISGTAKFNIVIRTVICKGTRAWYSAGGGIVWDSDPKSEYAESLLKGKALWEALSCID